jgi:hypothetical protein
MVDAVVEIDDIDISDREAVEPRRIDMARDKLTNGRIPRTQAGAKRRLSAIFGEPDPVRNSLELPFPVVLRRI